MLEGGYIKLHRSLLHWEWYVDRNTTTVFIHLLLTVNFEPRKWRGMVVERGQRLCSRSSLAKELHLSEKEVRTALDHLQKTGEVASLTSPQGTVITVIRYEDYQNGANETASERPTEGQRGANGGPTKGQRGANEGPVNKKDKKEEESKKAKKEEKEKAPLKGGQKERSPYGEFGNVYLSDEERTKLEQRFGTNETAQAVEELSTYCQSRGKSYRDYYATLVSWCKRNAAKVTGGPRREKSFAELAAEMEGSQ